MRKGVKGCWGTCRTMWRCKQREVHPSRSSETDVSPTREVAPSLPCFMGTYRKQGSWCCRRQVSFIT